MNDSFIKENVYEILDYIDEGIHIIDKNGRIVYYNRFAQLIDDIDRDKAIGRHILEVYPSLSYETSTLLTVMKTGEPILNVEQTFINYKGKKITTINSSIPIKYKKKIVGALEISRDITQVKQMSETIVELQDELYNGKKKEKKEKKKNKRAKYTFMDIIGENKEMLDLKSLALRAADTDAPVLVYGDTGTGKELFVHSIHNASSRKDKPFIAQNCAALPANLLEGILFGTVKGGFTGAEDRPGLFELANGGTLFLDEINSMPLELQAKLLRVLQDNVIRRVGDIKTVDVDVRIITATNVPPEEAVETKQMRKDLYYRLNVVSFEIPPLKDRKDDIPILTKFFIEKFNKKLGRNVENVSNEVMKIFFEYDWEGNVRELEHLLEGIMSIYDVKTIEVEHLTPKFRNYKKNIRNNGIKSLKETLEDTEKNIILNALKTNNENITHTAEMLKIPRQTLQYKINKYNLK
ncbi:sigma 54-interacting transcriptional regulator [Anaerosalibacter bizertensis]|uniref:Sigma 54-interacting transcriptional regulator n=3 Tax=Anaerosalibacter bizertensis TaxID=932217 RepID=A0A9Q4ADN0_9FIRM|nr:sigma 54-interacting transcriptional regulator [Anaerosalibacter bizertensis]MBV1820319.1 sigma 54-interacting transcriptional regulator [Bacteroidales bacterium MSK.15.36]MCG4565484.1 sigma 54-interacting transcriptional regulator [Anaerosalibacter bizertensis]MCG4583242.1 sigma 54-interacting transcriptional regulator [Anaerosalibacter bizertensis]